MGRVYIFLSSEQILSSLIEKSQNILKINKFTIPICKLLNPTKRIIISNVHFPIPNQLIHKAGIKEIRYEHTLSFRCQIYIKHEDIPKLPGSLLININETNFRIFFTVDIVTCYTRSQWDIYPCSTIKIQ